MTELERDEVKTLRAWLKRRVDKMNLYQLRLVTSFIKALFEQ